MGEFTYGDLAVGLNSDKSENQDVRTIKQEYARIIDRLNNMRTQEGPGEKGRLLSIAITEAQTAAMWAVKAIMIIDQRNKNLDSESDSNKIL